MTCEAPGSIARLEEATIDFELGPGTWKPSTVIDYPIVAIADLRPAKACGTGAAPGPCGAGEGGMAAVRGGLPRSDFVDRGPDVRGAIEVVLDLAARHPVVTAVMGNHDLALVRAARLDDGPASAYWIDGYRDRYDHEETFRSYLGRPPRLHEWERDLEEPPRFHPPGPSRLPGHATVARRGAGASVPPLRPVARAGAIGRGAAFGLTAKSRWDDSLRPRPGTKTAGFLADALPGLALGADKRLSDRPLSATGRIQVTGHVRVAVPEVDAVRIRLDTSGGCGELTACLLRAPDTEPIFVASS